MATMFKRASAGGMYYCKYQALDERTGRVREFRESLGTKDPDEARARLAKVEAAERDGLAASEAVEKARTNPSIDTLAERYLEWARGEYATGTEPDSIGYAIRPLLKLYGNTPAREFGPVKLARVRDAMIADGLSRSYINSSINRTRRVFKWGAAQEILPPDVYHALAAVDGLRRGRGGAKETPPVQPVSDAHINATLPLLPAPLAAMVRFQLLTSARPGEIVGLRPCDVDQSAGDVWTITLSEHKTAYQNRERVIHVGPKAQAVLRPYLLRAADSPCFSPRESEIERHALCATHRRAGQQRNPKATDRAIGDRYDVASYRRAISRACVAAGVPRWAPNQLRHAAATRVRKELGLEAAQVLLGHARADVTQVYAERDNALAREVALRLG